MGNAKPGFNRRFTLLSLAGAPFLLGAQQQDDPLRRPPPDPNDPDPKLPNGKSQKIAMAKQAHEDALKDTQSLIGLAQDLDDELKRAGDFVVSVSAVKKTEEIEKLARRIRNRLK